MRMILVHGINQGSKSADIVREEWLRHLRKTYRRHGPDPLKRLSRIQAAFYGAKLEQLTAFPATPGAIAQGVEEAPDDFDMFAKDALAEMGIKLGATAEMYAQEANQTVVAQGAGVHKKWLKAVSRVVQRVSPLHGSLALRLLAEAHAYISNPHNARQVDALVQPLFEDDEPAIVVAHSLGTIVAYKLLRKFAEDGRPRCCPLFLTLGSPLGIDVVRMAFAVPRTAPANVMRWVNGADPEDFVALRVALTADNFGEGIENISDIENGYDDPHGIKGYLSDERVAAAIRDAIMTPAKPVRAAAKRRRGTP